MVYVIVEVPCDKPDRMPDVKPTVAIVVLLLDQVPPVLTSLNNVLLPWQTVAAPEIAAGGANTLTVADEEQPAVV
jgi:hypothetical protein